MKAAFGVALAALAISACGGVAEPPPPMLVFLGEAIINPASGEADDPPVGGLSSLLWDRGAVYYSISDDRGQRGPARYYRLEIDLSNGRLDADGAVVTGWHPLRDASGEPFEFETYDLEGFTTDGEHLFASSEGDASANLPPFVGAFSPDGQLLERLGLPPGFAPAADGSSGIRNNLAFESLTLDPTDRFLFTATESALLQDGPAATPEAGTMARILRFDRTHGVFDAQFAYPIEPVHAEPPNPGGQAVNGLVELVALSGEHLLALERSFVADAYPIHSIKLFEVCLEGATDISAIPSLAEAGVGSFQPAAKRLVVDIVTLVPRFDNIEGFTFGPTLPSGERTLIFISDDNFAPQRQVTQVLAFAVSAGAFQGCGDAEAGS